MTHPSAIPSHLSPQVLEAMSRFRMDDNHGALSIAEAALVEAADKAPLMAVASLAALRLGLPQRAIPHLESLIALNPGDRASRANLANAYVQVGKHELALELVRGETAPGLARIEGFILQEANDFAGAVAAYRRAIAGDPNDLSSWNNLGNVLSASGDVDGAIEALERAISIAPGELRIYLNLAEVLKEADRPEARLRVLTDARKLAPEDQQVLVELGMTYARVDDLDSAISTMKHAINLSPGFCDAHIELGMIYENLNRVEELTELVGSVDQTKAPAEFAFLLAWQARREGRFEDAAELASRIPETVHPRRRFHLIGGIEDRRGNANEAFAAFEQMNREAIDSSPPPIGPTYREEVTSDLAKWTDEWAREWPPFEPSDQYRDPVFLVGFPRSGTTLLDTMLMGQGELSVLEERPMMARTIRQLGENEDLPSLTPERVHELREMYFTYAREFGWDGTRWLVDKHPLNMERVPTIHRLFPNARVILAERHPYDVVLSCFMANFQLNLAMRSFADLEEAARTYDAVWRAWQRGIELFPVDWRAVRYERLVADPRAELEPLVSWLGLGWNDRLLDHTTTARERGRVRTASYSQIGESLYIRATDRWKRYAEHLKPVIPILRPWAEKMDYLQER
ncbi:tetratricopeptide repeat-containing sulfotransferase family protein [Erythrobacter mangrovi]|uniref:Sulfotransferase n=1 Tax=Erythrobacter mangrovi TaxID=2739433 RepID=A0A7D3XXU9_9SPHN|nr:tetratricopeptide repeat-containing sulfotransferase family protein [Erythrobacter mangrovi]QKG70192.1 sulfotransferase [Erythrobacter mangrovi]